MGTNRHLWQGQRRLEPSRIAAHLHLGDPLDLAVTAIAGSDEPQGEAVLDGELLIPGAGGQQEERNVHITVAVSLELVRDRAVREFVLGDYAGHHLLPSV